MAIAAISLRSPANSEALCDNCVAEVIVEGMKAHSGSPDIQVLLLRHKNKCIAIEMVDIIAEKLCLGHSQHCVSQ
jgi:hypothetical protein